MTNLLINTFIKDKTNKNSPSVRESYGKLAGSVGIVSNIILFAAKLFAGIISGSISITADAANNLSDSASSIITLAGFKLSGMPADEDHPYGHARYEYISGLIVSCIIIVIGFQFFVSSAKKIINPSDVSYTLLFWIILTASMLIKTWQSFFNAKIGKIISSPALAAAAADSRNDVITTGVILISAVISHFTGFIIDGYMGALVAVFILYSGIGLIRQTLSPLLGEAPESSLVDEIQQKILSYESVIGLHDLMVHNYGPNRRFASVHVELPAKQDIMVSHDIIDTIERDFAAEMQISLVIHLDPVVTDDPKLNELKAKIQDIIANISAKLDMHDFRMVEGVSRSNLIFDVVVPPRFKISDKDLREKISDEVKKINENYFCVIAIDRSYITSMQDSL